MNIVELFATLGFKMGEGEEVKLKDFLDLLSEVNLSSIMAATGLGVLGNTIAKLSEEAANYAVEIKTLSNQTGISVEELQRWEKAVEKVGGKAEETGSSIANLVQQLYQVRMGFETPNIAWTKIGLTLADDWKSALFKLRDYLQSNAAAADKTWVSKQFGIGPEFQEFLEHSKDLAKDLHDTVAPSSKEIEEMANEFKVMKETLQEIQAIGMRIASDFAPFVKEVLRLTEFFGILLDMMLLIDNKARDLRDSVLGGAVIFLTGNKPSQGGSHTNNVNINVDGSSDPIATAKKVRDELSRWLNGASYQQAGATT